MIRLLPYALLLGLLFAVGKEGKEKTKFDVTGIVIGKDGEGLKKVKLTIFNDIGKKIETGKSNKSGEFKFKKMKAGTYRIVGEHKKDGEVVVDFSINISSKYTVDKNETNANCVTLLPLALASSEDSFESTQ